MYKLWIAVGQWKIYETLEWWMCLRNTTCWVNKLSDRIVIETNVSVIPELDSAYQPFKCSTTSDLLNPDSWEPLVEQEKWFSHILQKNNGCRIPPWAPLQIQDFLLLKISFLGNHQDWLFGLVFQVILCFYNNFNLVRTVLSFAICHAEFSGWKQISHIFSSAGPNQSKQVLTSMEFWGCFFGSDSAWQ